MDEQGLGNAGSADSEASSRSGSTRSISSWKDLGELLFRLRDYTPIPLVFLVLFTNESTVISATFGTLLMAFGELFRIYSVAFIGKVSRTRNTETTGNNLITGGPFAWVRNPLYVGNFFITFGVAVYGNVPLVIALTVALFAIQYHAIVKYEESLLIRSFGDQYKTYMETVPAWIPKAIGPVSSWEWPDTFGPALVSEKRTLTAIAFMLIALMAVHF